MTAQTVDEALARMRTNAEAFLAAKQRAKQIELGEELRRSADRLYHALKREQAEAEPKGDQPDVIKVDEPEAIEVPEAAAAGVDAAYAEAEKTRKRTPRKPRKDGQASDTAKAIAGNREPVASA